MMNKYLLFAFLVSSLASFATAQTRAPNDGQVAYYRQTALVSSDGKRSTGDNSGQFITFTHAGCYDSNKERHDVGNGFLKYNGLDTEKRIHIYYGDSYWGSGSNYYFSEDFARLNIRTSGGITYVYERTYATAGVTTSSLIKSKTSDTGGGGTIGTWGVTPPPPPPPPLPPPNTALEKKWYDCSCCKGTGNCRIQQCSGGTQQCGVCNGSGQRYNTYTKLYERCSNTLCRGGRINCASCNRTGRCNCCNGKRGSYM